MKYWPAVVGARSTRTAPEVGAVVALARYLVSARRFGGEARGKITLGARVAAVLPPHRAGRVRSRAGRSPGLASADRQAHGPPCAPGA